MPSKAGTGELVSHGICEACADNLFSKTSVPLERYLDRLTEPVIVVDDDVTALYLNRQALNVLGKTSKETLGRKGGEVFDCIYSQLPEGCGRTIHCSGCAIRRAVTSTHTTGKAQVQVPATLTKGDPDQPDSIACTITTVKKGNVVMLRVYRME